MASFASRYARAFSQVAQTTGLDARTAQQQLRDFAATLSGSRELREVLINPALPAKQKLKVIDAIAARLKMTKPVRNFLAVIMDHQRLMELEGILSEYAALVDTTAGVVEVEVISARPLETDEKDHLTARAGELAGKEIHASFREDASILGGAVLKIGSTIYDGSLRAQLAEMKQRLTDAV